MTESLILNPNARIEPTSQAGVRGYRVFAPARTGGACDVVVCDSDTDNSLAIVSAELTNLLGHMCSANGDVSLDDQDVEALVKLKLLLPTHDVSARVEYECMIDESPGQLIELTSCFELSPSFAITTSLDTAPYGINSNLFEHRWNRRCAVGWVKDLRFGGVFPYHLSAVVEDKLRTLMDGRRVSFTDVTLRHLLDAQILVDSNADLEWSRNMDRARRSYKLNAYALIPSAVPSLHLESLGTYYRDLIREGYVPFGDRQVPLRYYRHSEHVMCYFHEQFRPLYATVLETKIKPSYCYLGSYLPGAELKRHTDREQCEFTASTQIDFLPTSAIQSQWVLHLEQDDSPLETFGVNLRRGDTVIYRGRELAHYRSPLEQGRSSTSFFLHYVHDTFDGPLY